MNIFPLVAVRHPSAQSKNIDDNYFNARVLSYVFLIHRHLHCRRHCRSRRHRRHRLQRNWRLVNLFTGSVVNVDVVVTWSGNVKWMQNDLQTTATECLVLLCGAIFFYFWGKCCIFMHFFGLEGIIQMFNAFPIRYLKRFVDFYTFSLQRRSYLSFSTKTILKTSEPKN